MRATTLMLALIVSAGCQDGSEEPELCDATLDADADGLDDCAEEALGTAKDKADTDGDGMSDFDEVECISNPLDIDEVCYACGWGHNDPGDLGPIGPNEGDTMANLKFTDQCGERVDLHDFAGSYHILFMTAEWCTSCLAEAAELRERTQDFRSETGLEFSYMIGLFEDTMGGAPSDESADTYADIADARRTVPVLSDKPQRLIVDTPYDGSTLPGKCVLSPDLEMLDCFTGHGDDAEAMQLIRDHAGI